MCPSAVTGSATLWGAWAAARTGSLGPVKYTLPTQAPAGVPPPLVEGLQQALADMFVGAGLPNSADVELMVAVMSARLSPNTWRTYSSVFGQFVTFCVSEGLPFLPATEAVGLQWAVHLAKRGTVQADTAGGYFSAVNTVHELLGWHKPCVGVPFDSFPAPQGGFAALFAGGRYQGHVGTQCGLHFSCSGLVCCGAG